jgi:hypothetical protein
MNIYELERNLAAMTIAKDKAVEMLKRFVERETSMRGADFVLYDGLVIDANNQIAELEKVK